MLIGIQGKNKDIHRRDVHHLSLLYSTLPSPRLLIFDSYRIASISATADTRSLQLINQNQQLFSTFTKPTHTDIHTMFSKIALIASILPFALAQIIPTSPSGNTVVNAGGDIQALWNADTSGQWTDVEIQLMTGDNLNVSDLGRRWSERS